MNQSYLSRKLLSAPSMAAVVLSAPTGKQLLVYSFSAYLKADAGGLNVPAGIGYSFDTAAWNAYSVFGASTTNITAALQAGTSTTILDQTIGHSFVVEAKKTFNMLSFTISQAQAGSPVYALEFWNGSAYVASSAFNTYTFPSGETVISFGEPTFWTTGAVTAGYYAMRVRITTAGSQDVKASALHVSNMFTLRDILRYQHVQATFEDSQLLLEAGEGLIYYFSVTGTQNICEVSYKINP